MILVAVITIGCALFNILSLLIGVPALMCAIMVKCYRYNYTHYCTELFLSSLGLQCQE